MLPCRWGASAGGTQGILGFNYGARQVDRVRQAQKYIVGLCVGYTAIFLCWPGWRARCLSGCLPRTGVAQEAFEAIKICTLAIIPLGVQYELVDGFTGIGQVRLCLPLSFWRKLVYFVAIFALPAAFGARAAFYAEPLSDITAAVTIVLAMGKILRERAVTGPDNSRPHDIKAFCLFLSILSRRSRACVSGTAKTRTQNRKTAQGKRAARAPLRGMGPASRWFFLSRKKGKREGTVLLGITGFFRFTASQSHAGGRLPRTGRRWCTFGVHLGQAVLHGDGAGRAGAHALATADAPNVAHGHGALGFVAAGAPHHRLSFRGTKEIIPLGRPPNDWEQHLAAGQAVDTTALAPAGPLAVPQAHAAKAAAGDAPHEEGCC